MALSMEERKKDWKLRQESDVQHRGRALQTGGLIGSALTTRRGLVTMGVTAPPLTLASHGEHKRGG